MQICGFGPANLFLEDSVVKKGKEVARFLFYKGGKFESVKDKKLSSCLFNFEPLTTAFLFSAQNLHKNKFFRRLVHMISNTPLFILSSTTPHLKEEQVKKLEIGNKKLGRNPISDRDFCKK